MWTPGVAQFAGYTGDRVPIRLVTWVVRPRECPDRRDWVPPWGTSGTALSHKQRKESDNTDTQFDHPHDPKPRLESWVSKASVENSCIPWTLFTEDLPRLLSLPSEQGNRLNHDESHTPKDEHKCRSPKEHVAVVGRRGLKDHPANEIHDHIRHCDIGLADRRPVPVRRTWVSLGVRIAITAIMKPWGRNARLNGASGTWREPNIACSYLSLRSYDGSTAKMRRPSQASTDRSVLRRTPYLLSWPLLRWLWWLWREEADPHSPDGRWHYSFSMWLAHAFS